MIVQSNKSRKKQEMQIYNWGWTGLPIGIFLILNKYYLHSGELWLLIYPNILLFSTLLPPRITQITHLITITAMSTHVLLISKQTNGPLSDKKYSMFVRILLYLEEELSIFVYITAAWLFLRVYTDKTSSFGIGVQFAKNQIFNGVNSTLCGWNCTQLEFVIVPSIWLIFNLLSLTLGSLIIKVQKDKDNLYKEYVLKYLALPYTIFSLIALIHNLYSYLNTHNLFDCVKFWKYGFLMQIAVYYGFALSTLYFFHAKKGVFLIQGKQNSQDKDENQHSHN